MHLLRHGPRTCFWGLHELAGSDVPLSPAISCLAFSMFHGLLEQQG